MPVTTKRNTSLTLSADVLEGSRASSVNVAAVADKALQAAVAEAKRKKWRQNNSQEFAAQAAWHERNGHPLVDILVGPGTSSWSD